MSTVAEPRTKKRELVFQSPAHLVHFILTCLDEDELGPGTPLYERGLNRIYLKKSPPTLHLHVSGQPDLVQLVESMAKANRGEAVDARPLSEATHRLLTIDQVMRAVCLTRVPTQGLTANHWLLAVWGADA